MVLFSAAASTLLAFYSLGHKIGQLISSSLVWMGTYTHARTLTLGALKKLGYMRPRKNFVRTSLPRDCLARTGLDFSASLSLFLSLFFFRHTDKRPSVAVCLCLSGPLLFYRSFLSLSVSPIYSIALSPSLSLSVSLSLFLLPRNC